MKFFISGSFSDSKRGRKVNSFQMMEKQGKDKKKTKPKDKSKKSKLF